MRLRDADATGSAPREATGASPVTPRTRSENPPARTWASGAARGGIVALAAISLAGVGLVGYGAQGVKPIFPEEFRHLRLNDNAFETRRLPPGAPNARDELIELALTDLATPDVGPGWLFTHRPEALRIVRLAERAVADGRYDIATPKASWGVGPYHTKELTASVTLLHRVAMEAAREGDAALLRRLLNASIGLGRLTLTSDRPKSYGEAVELDVALAQLCREMVDVASDTKVLDALEEALTAPARRGDWREDARATLVWYRKAYETEKLLAGQVQASPPLYKLGPFESHRVYAVASKTKPLDRAVLRYVSERAQRDLIAIGSALSRYDESVERAKAFQDEILARYEGTGAAFEGAARNSVFITLTSGDDRAEFEKAQALSHLRERRADLRPNAL